MERIVKLTQKLTREKAEALWNKSVPVTAFAEIRKGPWRDLLRQDSGILWTNWVKNLGSPLLRVRDFESTPGLWLFRSDPSGHVFLIWSDGYKKHPWKGTSYEVVVNPDRMDTLAEAFAALVAVLEQYLPQPEPSS